MSSRKIKQLNQSKQDSLDKSTSKIDEAYADRTKAFLQRYYELEYYSQNFAALPVSSFSVFHQTVFKDRSKK